MTVVPIESGSVLGVLGGGQLGTMFAQAARRLGYHVAVWDPDTEAPAHRNADHIFATPFTDLLTPVRFSDLVRAATYEWENVPATLCEVLEHKIPVRPCSRILRLIQDRLTQKEFLAARGLPVPAFRPISSPDELPLAAEEVGFPCLCKMATFGYDGKGQWQIQNRDELEMLRQRLRETARDGSRWIVEPFLRFERELSVLVVRGADGGRRLYPVVENIHEAGILRTTRVPASVEHGIAERAAALAEKVVETLDGIGVFCTELFLMPDGRLLINEVAPRPHNSGHYTLDACTVSQFEQQVRALCGLPLGEVRLLSPAVMVNLIGDDVLQVGAGTGQVELFGTAGAALHLYGKRVVRPGRKMGHVTFLAEKPEEAWKAAVAFRRKLASRPLPSPF